MTDDLGFIKVRNWEKFQQYKDREPRWIKLYRSLNHNYEWCQLSEPARAHLVGIWLLAAEMGNKIPNDAKWIKMQIGARSEVKLGELYRLGFIESLDGGCELYTDVQENTEAYLEKSRVEKSRVEHKCVFSEWWARYPVGRKIDRVKCERKFNQLSATDRVAAAGPGYQAWLDHWTTIDTQYVPHPHTWLNNRRWEAEPPPRKKSVSSNGGANYTGMTSEY